MFSEKKLIRASHLDNSWGGGSAVGRLQFCVWSGFYAVHGQNRMQNTFLGFT